MSKAKIVCTRCYQWYCRNRALRRHRCSPSLPATVAPPQAPTPTVAEPPRPPSPVSAPPPQQSSPTVTEPTRPHRPSPYRYLRRHHRPSPDRCAHRRPSRRHRPPPSRRARRHRSPPLRQSSRHHSPPPNHLARRQTSTPPCRRLQTWSWGHQATTTYSTPGPNSMAWRSILLMSSHRRSATRCHRYRRRRLDRRPTGGIFAHRIHSLSTPSPIKKHRLACGSCRRHHSDARVRSPLSSVRRQVLQGPPEQEVQLVCVPRLPDQSASCTPGIPSNTWDPRLPRPLCDCSRCVQHLLDLLHADRGRHPSSQPRLRFHSLPSMSLCPASTTLLRRLQERFAEMTDLRLLACGCHSFHVHRQFIAIWRAALELARQDSAGEQRSSQTFLPQGRH